MHKDINKIENIQRHAARFTKMIMDLWNASATSLVNNLRSKFTIKKSYSEGNDDA